MSEIFEGSTEEWSDTEKAHLEAIARKGGVNLELEERERFNDVLATVKFPDGGETMATGDSREQALRNAELAATAWGRASGQEGEQ